MDNNRPRLVRSMGAGARLDALCVAVIVMRRSQWRYFRSPDPLHLVKARESERAVDAILEEIMPGQGQLFPEEPGGYPLPASNCPKSG